MSQAKKEETSAFKNDQVRIEKEQMMINQFQKRKQMNLNFFSTYAPKLYQQMMSYQLKRYQIDIQTETDETDLIVDNERLYHGQAKDYAKRELAHFMEVSGPGQLVKTLDPPSPGDFKFPRYFSLSADKMVRSSPVANEKLEGGYRIEDSYLCMVFMGLGLGYHIENFIKNFKTHSLIIFEPSFDIFFATLYTVDWHLIITTQDCIKKGREIQLLIGNSQNDNDQKNDKDEILQYKRMGVQLQEALKDRSPHYPLMTLFYNHLAEKKHSVLIERISQNSLNHLITWGNYDDEVNQLSQAIFNIVQNPISLPTRASYTDQVPVCIVGAGPSLDNRIKTLKEMASYAVVIACGTALNALYANRIKPDILVVLESDYLALEYIERIHESGQEGRDFLDRIMLVGPIHLNARLIESFDSFRFYIKKECGLADIMEGMGLVLEGGVPTCTNLGFAIATYYAFKKIFLFGLDFGFTDIDKHHSKDTIYYDFEQLSDGLHRAYSEATDYSKQHLLEDTDVYGEKIFTDPYYFASKVHLENHLERFRNRHYQCEVFNCSQGATIQGTKWLKNEDLEKLAQGTDGLHGIKHRLLSTLFGDAEDTFKQNRHPNTEVLNSRLNCLRSSMREWENHLLNILKENDPVHDHSLAKLATILAFEIKALKSTNRPLYTMTRGSIWYILLIGLSHSMFIESLDVKDSKDNKDSKVSITSKNFNLIWRELFIEFLQGWSDHLNEVIKNAPSNNTNLWLDLSLHDPEPKRCANE